MNRLPRSRSVGSVGSLDGFNESLKYSKLHKKHGARPLPSYALPLGVALLIATAFFVAQSLTTKLPSADTLTLPELNVPRQSRVALEEGSGGAEEGEEGCDGDKCSIDGGSSSSRRRGGGVQQPTRHGGSSGGTAVDTAALEEAVGEIQELLSTTAKQQQQQQQRRGGTVSSSVLRHRSNAARRQQQQQQQRLGDGRGERQRPSSSVEEGQGVHATGGASPSGSSGSLAVQRRKHRRKSKYTASLKQDIDDLILEAAEVAKMHGIATEAGGDEDEAAAEQEDVSELEGVGADVLMRGAERCSPSSCSPHGACVEGRCQCVVMYSGKRCGHAVFLSWPFVSESMQHFGAGYEGDLVLHKRTRHFELKVFHPPNEAAGVAKQAFTVVADADTLARLRPLLPAQDAVLKGAAYRSCAVVGSSGSLLMHANGAAIDSHEAVFRFNAAPTAGYERHVGSRTTHRLTNLASWGFHEREGEAVLVHTSLPQTVEGLLWNGRQASPWNVLPLDPEFEDYMTRSFSFAPSQGLYGVVLALHVCRSVTLYGFGLSAQQGVLQRYYDPCEPLSNAGRVEPQWAVLASLATARLLGLAEPCTAECMVPGASGAALCRQCRDAVGLTVPPLPDCTDALRQQLAAQQYRVPWLTGGGSGDGSSTGGSGAQAVQQAASSGAGSSDSGVQAGQQAAGGSAGGT